MKKSAIATAVVLACASAFVASGAQAADVQTSIYGIADVGYASSSNARGLPGQTTGYSASGLITGGIAPTHIGVKVGRDLGDGLKAEAQLEAGIQFNNGNNDYAPGYLNDGQFFNRVAALAVSGEKWGRVSAGYQISPFVGALMGVDPMGLSQSGSALTFHLGDLALRNNGAVIPNAYDNLFQRSLVTYATPNFNGFSATLSHGFAQDSTNQSGAAATQGPQANKTSANILTAQYAAGGFNVAAAMYQSNDAYGNKMKDDMMVGAGYRFGQFGVKAYTATYKASNIALVPIPAYPAVPTGIDSSAFKNSVIGLGGDANVTPKVNVALAYYSQKGSGTLNNNEKTNMTVLKGTYGLDRGSFLYATVSSTKNSNGADLGPFLGSSFNDGSFTPVNGSTTGYSVGMFYAF